MVCLKSFLTGSLPTCKYGDFCAGDLAQVTQWTKDSEHFLLYQQCKTSANACISSLHSESGMWCHVVDSKPGPGTYSPALTATTSRKAAFSIRARPQVSTHGSFSPGPGQYGTGPSKPHVGLAPNPPCYTFGLKALGDKEAERKPGPADEPSNFCLLQSMSALCSFFRSACQVACDLRLFLIRAYQPGA